MRSSTTKLVWSKENQMIIDGLLVFDSNLALTSTQTSTNVIDLVNARDVGVGDAPAMKLTVMSIIWLALSNPVKCC
jgi:hypothetical protein